MILADTSIWVAHMRNPLPEFTQLLNSNDVLIHALVIGEIACGTIRDRMGFLSYLWGLPMIQEVGHDIVLEVIDTNRLMGRGVGFVDFHLLTSIIVRGDDTMLWTRDRRLNQVAAEMGVAHAGRPL